MALPGVAPVLVWTLVLMTTLLLSTTSCRNGEGNSPEMEALQEPTPSIIFPTPAAESKPVVFPLGRVRGIAVSDNQIFPAGKVAITAAKSVQDSDKIVTSGLNNVGVGSYVYLEGRIDDSKGVPIRSWKWQVDGPTGQSVALDGATTKNPRFVAGQLGDYTVKVTATSERDETSTSVLTVSAGRYAGSSLCNSCHDGRVAKDIASKWKETGHASGFEAVFSSNTIQADQCVRCHSTAYDESVDDGGFDDLAKADGWDPVKDGSISAWIKAKNMTLADLKKDPKLSVLMNVQCESCHGPGGSRHPDTKSYEVGVCAQCHTDQPAQMKFSKHADELKKEVAGDPSCFECHTGQGFVEIRVRGKQAIFPGQTNSAKTSTLPSPGAMSAITCVACHDPHVATNPVKESGETRSLQLRLQGSVAVPEGAKIDAGKSAICISCHTSQRDTAFRVDYLAGKKTWSTHDNTQVDVYYGFGAFDFGRALESSPHSKLVRGSCVACHMAENPEENPGSDSKSGTGDESVVNSVGGHSFSVANLWKSKDRAQPVLVENVAVCSGCHTGADKFNRMSNGDYDGNGKIEGIETEVAGLLKLVESKLPKDEKGQVIASNISERNTTEVQRKALWNYFLVKNDGSRGVHNPVYAVQILQQTFKALAGSDVPFATIR